MFFDLEVNEELNHQLQANLEGISNLFSDLTESSGQNFKPSDDFCMEYLSGQQLAVITQGAAELLVHGRRMALLGQGDIIGFSLHHLRPSIKIRTEMALTAKVIPHDAIQNRIRQDEKFSQSLHHLFQEQSGLFLEMLSLSLLSESSLESEILNIEEGQVIISQGSEDRNVYQLIDGRADVLVDGKKVGELGSNQIFGALAVLTGSPRNADIRATSNCLVMRIEAEDFLDLIRNKPAAVLGLVKDMAGIITKMNQKMIEIS